MTVSSSLATSKRYCGLWRNVSGWLRQPPALLSEALHAPVTCFSVQVLEKEKSDVLMTRQMASSLNWCRKSSKGIQNSPSSLNVSPSFSLCPSEMFAHSGDVSLKGPVHSLVPQGFCSLTRYSF